MKFFTNIRRKLFNRRVNREIFDRIMPHIQKEQNFGYSFSTNAEMDAQTEQLDTRALLDAIERHARNMPQGYGKAFRHVMHRDLHERLLMYEKIARRRVNRTCDPHFVAVHA
jgi:hypothetical protein